MRRRMGEQEEEERRLLTADRGCVLRSLSGGWNRGRVERLSGGWNRGRVERLRGPVCVYVYVCICECVGGGVDCRKGCRGCEERRGALTLTALPLYLSTSLPLYLLPFHLFPLSLYPSGKGKEPADVMSDDVIFATLERAVKSVSHGLRDARVVAR